MAGSMNVSALDSMSRLFALDVPRTGPFEFAEADQVLLRTNGSTASPGVYQFLKATDLDPLTKLIAFPAFERLLVRHLMIAPAPNHIVSLAIGDVDGLKSHVERANASDPTSFGHLAGNRVMAELGRLTREFVRVQYTPEDLWCAATFGGDEIILLTNASRASFAATIEDLRDHLGRHLPTSVSFAYVSYPHPGPFAAHNAHSCALRMLAAVDRALFSAKHAAHDNGTGPRGEVVQVSTDPSGDSHSWQI